MRDEVDHGRHQHGHPVSYDDKHRNDDDDDRNFRRAYGQKVRAESINSRHSLAPDDSLIVCHWTDYSNIAKLLRK